MDDYVSFDSLGAGVLQMAGVANVASCGKNHFMQTKYLHVLMLAIGLQCGAAVTTVTSQKEDYWV